MSISQNSRISRIDVIPTYTGSTVSMSVSIRTDVVLTDESGKVVGAGDSHRSAFTLTADQIAAIQSLLVSLGVPTSA